MRITNTLRRSTRDAISEAFREATERFHPDRAILCLALDGEPRTIEAYKGYTQRPLVEGTNFRWDLVSACFDQPSTVRLVEGSLGVCVVPVKRPPEGAVEGVLYFEFSPGNLNFHPDEIFAVEALAGRTGAELALLRKRLLSPHQRVIPTPDQTETWSGVRRAGLEAFKAGVHDMALSFLERARDIAEGWGPTRELAESLNDYGQVLRANDRTEEAGEQFERGISVLEQAGLERERVAISLLNNMGGVHHAKGNLAEAERMYRHGLEIMTEHDQENKASPAVMANLGVIAVERGDPAMARVWLEQALASATRMFGEAHPHTQKCREKLAEL